MNYKKFFIILWSTAFILIVLTIFQELRVNADEKTTTRIIQVSRDIELYARSNRTVPESLSEVKSNDTDGLVYKKIDNERYELCATFKTTKPGYKTDNEQSTPTVHVHGAGFQCFKVKPYIPEAITTSNSSSYSSIQKRARDNERQTDIKALHGQIEAYYAQNGRYPTLANMNDASFRSTNMKGLDAETIKDPSSIAKILAAKPAKNTYSYDVQRSGGGACDNSTNDCAQYTLTATLEGGGTYTKSNLN